MERDIKLLYYRINSLLIHSFVIHLGYNHPALLSALADEKNHPALANRSANGKYIYKFVQCDIVWQTGSK